MSFINDNVKGRVYAPGYFLADAENCLRVTAEVDSTDERVITENGGKFLKMGSVWPSNDKNAAGILYEDVDVTTGNMPGSVVIKGVVYEDRLPEEVNTDAKTALQSAGIKFITSDSVTRPY